MLAEWDSVRLKEAVSRQTMVGSCRAKILMYVKRHALVKRRIRLVQHAPAADAECVLSSAASQEGRILFPVNIDVVCPPMGPSGCIIPDPYTVSKSQKPPLAGRVEHKIVLAKGLAGVFTSPLRMKPLRLLKCALRIFVPFNVPEQVHALRADLNLDPRLRSKWHGKVTCVRVLVRSDEIEAADRVHDHPVAQPEKVPDGGFDARLLFAVPVDAQDPLAVLP